MEVIVNHRRTTVIFDDRSNVFLKKFNPNFESRIKYFFRLRRYPGKNFNFIANELKKIGVNVPKVVSYTKYSVKTKKINGILLREVIYSDPKIVKDFLDLIVKILNNNFYFGDFNTGNFIYSEGKIYAIDLEDYRKERFISRGHQEALRRLKKTLKNDEWYHYIEKKINK